MYVLEIECGIAALRSAKIAGRASGGSTEELSALAAGYGIRFISDSDDEVIFSGAGKLLLVQGEAEALRITADDNLLPYIDSRVGGSTLHIGLQENEWNRNLRPSQQILFELTVNSEGKYGKKKTADIAYKMKKKDGDYWSPLKATISKAEKHLNELAELDAGDVPL